MGKTTDSQDDSRPGEALTVEQLNNQISEVVGSNEELQDVRCVGELTNVSESDVALYFTLTDGNHELSCLILESRHQSMDVVVEDGMEIVVEGTSNIGRRVARSISNPGTYTRSVNATRRQQSPNWKPN
jgi:exonuclease VII large subunit